MVCRLYKGPVYHAEKLRFLSLYSDGPGYGPSERCCTYMEARRAAAAFPRTRLLNACSEFVSKAFVDATVNNVGEVLVSPNLLQLVRAIENAIRNTILLITEYF